MKLEEHDSKYALFVDRATSALVALAADKTPVTGAAIAEWVEKNHSADRTLLEPSWGSHLNAATSDPETRIRRVPGRYTYTLIPVAPEPAVAAGPSADAAQGLVPQATDATAPVVPEATAPDATATPAATAEEQAQYTKREAALYPVLRDWLAGRKFRAADTSNARGGGTWGNPDVAGLRITEGLLGAREVELATVEAKVSMDRWRQLIFEAVSHKRFAHRAYFAFAFGTDEPALDRVPDVAALRQYAERFRLGILVVFMPEEMFKRLREDTGTISLDGTELRVEELWPAVYDPVRPEETVQYLRGTLRLESDDAVYAFGRA